ncbi:putative BZIP domain-containing protein [Seiridium unicorne]|uniref:BZIP domain-containing protein n=1 Tax=Seiridium unicorne TaxID=138068 RepID=A0ABR2VAW1_9PEZI
MNNEDTKEKRRLQNRESQRRFRQRRQYYRSPLSVELNEEQPLKPPAKANAEPTAEPNGWPQESSWPSSMPSTAFFQTSGTLYNERSSVNSMVPNGASVIPPVQMAGSSPRATQNWGIQTNSGVVGSNAPSQPGPQQFESQFSQQTAITPTRAPVLQGITVAAGSTHHGSHSLPLSDLGEQREPSASLAQHLLPPYSATGVERTSRDSVHDNDQNTRADERFGSIRERPRRLSGLRSFSRAEEMVMDVERLYDFAIDLGILEEDEAMLVSLRDMRSRFRALTRRVVTDDEDDLIVKDFGMDSD